MRARYAVCGCFAPPRGPAPPDILRDRAIERLGAHAVKDGALVAAMIYETHDGRLVIIGSIPARTMVEGLLDAAYRTAYPAASEDEAEG